MKLTFSSTAGVLNACSFTIAPHSLHGTGKLCPAEYVTRMERCSALLSTYILFSFTHLCMMFIVSCNIRVTIDFDVSYLNPL
jgi:hypothetical protein